MNFRSVIFLVCCVLSSLVSAGGVHTWHDVVSEKGDWQGRLVISSSNQKGFFTDSSGQKKGEIYDFSLSDSAPFVFGFGFDFDGTDFDVSYTLTLYQTSFASKACVFNVSAKGPAQPDVRIEKFNGASCDFEVVHGRGENFKAG
jgi:hypothetical protein